jgi:DNA mismatch endonuclease (patch repair protein)
MAAVKSKDSRAELALRSALHRKGFRYRLHPKDVFGRPDIVNRRLRVAIFVDGDLWHGNPDEWKRRGRASLADLFPNRTDWWVTKIERNIARDAEVTARLRAEGWLVIRAWESEIAADAEGVAASVLERLVSRR